MPEHVRKITAILMQAVLTYIYSYSLPAFADSKSAAAPDSITTNRKDNCENPVIPPGDLEYSITTNHFDRMHDRMFLRLQRPVGGFDRLFARNQTDPLPVPLTKFRLGTDLQVKEVDDKKRRLF